MGEFERGRPQTGDEPVGHIDAEETFGYPLIGDDLGDFDKWFAESESRRSEGASTEHSPDLTSGDSHPADANNTDRPASDQPGKPAQGQGGESVGHINETFDVPLIGDIDNVELTKRFAERSHPQDASTEQLPDPAADGSRPADVSDDDFFDPNNPNFGFDIRHPLAGMFDDVYDIHSQPPPDHAPDSPGDTPADPRTSGPTIESSARAVHQDPITQRPAPTDAPSDPRPHPGS